MAEEIASGVAAEAAPNQGWSCRRAQVRDLPALMAIEEACFPEGDRFRPRQWRYLVQKAVSAEVWVLVRSNAGTFPANGARENSPDSTESCRKLDQDPAACGVLLMPRQRHFARIYSIAVHPQHRGQGLARLLLAQLEERARHNPGIARLSLEVHPDNKAAGSLYESCGYSPAGTRPNYYADGSHALILTKPLPPHGS